MTTAGSRALQRSCVRRLIAIAFLAACAAGCPGRPPVQRPTPGPSADELRAALTARQEAIRSMNARVRATSWIGGERLRASVLMLVTRAGQLRFEAEISLQGTVSILTTEGGRFSLLDLQKNELHRGPACPANVASLIRIPLSPAEVAAILLGDVKLDADADEQKVEVVWDQARGADVLELSARNGQRTRLFFQEHGKERDLVGVIHEDRSGIRWQTTYDDLRPIAGARLPAMIRFAEGKDSFDQGVEIKFKDVTVNGVPRPEDFTIAVPPGVSVHNDGCGS
jgi:hypothetical protein